MKVAGGGSLGVVPFVALVLIDLNLLAFDELAQLAQDRTDGLLGLIYP